MAARMTSEERDRIKTYIRDGYSKSQISDLTGRSMPTIQSIRNQLKQEEGFDNYHVGGKLSKDIPCSPIVNTIKENEVDIPRKKHNLTVTRRTIRFVGEGTFFEYIISSDKDHILIRDPNGDNSYMEFKIKTKMLEAFMNELLDLAVEVDNFH